MRNRENNPFLPGAGAVPQVWIGRRAFLDGHDIARLARLRGTYTPGTVLIGPSGIGKSVLVNRFAVRSAADGDVVVDAVRVARRSDPVAQLAGAVKVAASHVASGRRHRTLHELMDRVDLVAVRGVQFAVKEGVGNPHLAVRDALVHFGEVLARENVGREQPRALLLRLDELQNADHTQRSALLTAIGDLLEYTVELDVPGGRVPVHLPVLVYVTGLPDLLNRATNVDTFRRRFDTRKLTLFTDAEVTTSLLGAGLPNGVTFTEDAAARLAELVGGDPYLFQYVGQAAWNAGDGPQVELADLEAADETTYAERLRIVEAASEDVPDGEAEVLDALYAVARDGDTARGTAVAAHLGRTPPQIATAARRLEQRALILRERGGWRVTHRLVRRLRETGDIV